MTPDLPTGEYAWSLEQIDSFLVAHEASILLRDGKPYVRFPPASVCPNREKLIAKLLPHLKARRAVLLEWIAFRYPTAFNADKNVQLEQNPGSLYSLAEHRAKLIAQCKERAALTNRVVYFLKRSGLAATEASKPVVRYYKYPRRRRVVIPVDREASHVCVEGDKQWIPLPRVTTAEEDVALGKGAGQAADRRAFRDRYVAPSFGEDVE